VFDVSNVDDIYKPATWDGNEYYVAGFICNDVALQGNCAYLSSSTGMVYVADISFLDAMELFTYCTLSGDAYGFKLDEYQIFTAIGTKGLKAVNIAEASYPTIKCW